MPGLNSGPRDDLVVRSALLTNDSKNMQVALHMQAIDADDRTP